MHSKPSRIIWHVSCEVNPCRRCAKDRDFLRVLQEGLNNASKLHYESLDGEYMGLPHQSSSDLIFGHTIIDRCLLRHEVQLR